MHYGAADVTIVAAGVQLLYFGAAAISTIAGELNKWCSSRNHSSWGVQRVHYGAAAVSRVAGELNKWCSSRNYSSCGVQIVHNCAAAISAVAGESKYCILVQQP